jgi:hypothetical protein
VRGQALELLAQISPWTAQTWQLLLEVSARDADPAVRARAVALQREAPEPDAALLAELAAQLGAEPSAEVRLQLLALVGRSLRLPEVRAALAGAFAQGAGAMADPELGAFADALAPYAARDAAVRDQLLAPLERLPRASSRAQVLSRALPRLKVEEALPLLLRLFSRERDEELRAQLFRSLRPLSLSRHPELVRVFCEELLEPGSKLRAQCASALAAVAEQDAQAASALEEVIGFEQDRELVRCCLDGYLRPRVQRRFAPLFAVITNEALDAASRQRCLEEAVKLPPTDAESEQLAEALAGLPPGTLRRPS